MREDKLLEIAETDGLTGFFNKISVAKQVREQLESVPAGSLFMIDIDDFKTINDTYGHTVGDFWIREVASQLRQQDAAAAGRRNTKRLRGKRRFRPRGRRRADRIFPRM